MPLAGFEPAIPANQRPQTQALDRAAIGIGKSTNKHHLAWKVSEKLAASLPSHLQITNSNAIWIPCRVLSEFGRFPMASAEVGRR
jgi:hypothetical protein